MEDIKRINLNEVQYKVTDEDVRTKYPTLDDLPSINGQPVVGDLTLSQLGIQPQGEYARYTEVPQRVSELSNDLNFQSRTEVHDMIMDELSNFEVASFEVVDEIPTPETAREGVRYFYSNPDTGKVEEYIKIGNEVVMVGSSSDVDLSNYYNKNETNVLLNAKANITDVPVRVSDLNNDRGFITKTVTDLQYYTKTTDMNAALNLKADKTEIPTKTSQLTNDSGYITKSVNNLENYTKTTDLNDALDLKADQSDLEDAQDEIDNIKQAIDYKNTEYMGKVTVESIRTKNMFEKNFKEGLLDGTSQTNRVSSNSVIYLEAGTYTFSSNISSGYSVGIGVSNIPFPSSPSADWSLNTGWVSLPHTFVTTGGYFGVNIKKTDNTVLSPEEIINFNFQLEKGSVATEYSSHQTLNSQPPVVLMDTETPISVGTEITLNDSYKNYKYIDIYSSLWTSTFINHARLDTTWSSSEFLIKNTNPSGGVEMMNVIGNFTGNKLTILRMGGFIISSTQTILSLTGEPRIRKIVGYK